LGVFAEMDRVVAKVWDLVANFSNVMSFSVTKCDLNPNRFVASFAVIAIL
jgi:hypothetical protein